VLEEEQGAVRPDNAAQLVECAYGIVDRAEYERADHRVERGVGERQRLRPRLDDLGAATDLAQPLLQLSHHRPLGFDEHQLLDFLGVVLEVEARPGSHLEDSAAGVRQELAPAGGEPLALRRRCDAVVDRGDEPASQAHAS
jgi:hypothetical protein